MSPDYILRILNVSLTPSLFREICTPFLSLNTCARMYTHPCIHIHLAVSYSSSKTQLKCHLPDSSLLANCSLFCVPSETCTCISIKKKKKLGFVKTVSSSLTSTQHREQFPFWLSLFLLPFSLSPFISPEFMQLQRGSTAPTQGVFINSSPVYPPRIQSVRKPSQLYH